MAKAAPRGLESDGKSLWRSIASSYQLNADEYGILTQACFTADMIGKLEAAWVDKGCPMLSFGSQGQEVIHPLISELRFQRAALTGTLARLKLPDLDVSDTKSSSASSKARAAANARWGNVG